jgi:RHS repeat-associated protein
LLGRSHGYSAGNWSTHNCYHADGNGNITYLVDSSQAKAAAYRYDPFGNTISSSGTLAAANVYRFSSKEVHVKSGMDYYLYRFYDPNLQRWLNRDPLEERGGPNLYQFAWNNPANRLDPLGLSDTSNDKGILGGIWEWMKKIPDRGRDAGRCVRQWCGSKIPTGPANAAAGAATRVIGTVASGAQAGAGMTAIAAMQQYCGKCTWCRSQTFNTDDPEDCKKEKDCDDACKKCEEMKAKLPVKAL